MFTGSVRKFGCRAAFLTELLGGVCHQHSVGVQERKTGLGKRDSGGEAISTRGALQ